MRSSRSCIRLPTIAISLVVLHLGMRSSASLHGFARSQKARKGPSPDEGVPEKHTGYRGIGPPMMVGVGYVQREFCDGQSLASPGRWSPGSRVYPSSTAWSSVRECFWRFTTHFGTENLLVDLAMGKVEESPFPPDEVQRLKQAVIDVAARAGIRILRKSGDRVERSN